MTLKHSHIRYPRFFARFTPDGTVETLAKAETPEDAAQYPASAGWQEYGARLAGARGIQVTAGGHTMGIEVEPPKPVAPQEPVKVTRNVWMITQEDYSPIWESLIQRAGFADYGYHANAYFLDPKKMDTEDFWHIEDTKWRQVNAEVVDFHVLWDEDSGGNPFVDGVDFNGLYEWDSEQHDISDVYWFNTVDPIRSFNTQAQFLIVKKDDTQ